MGTRKSSVEMIEFENIRNWDINITQESIPSREYSMINTQLNSEYLRQITELKEEPKTSNSTYLVNSKTKLNLHARIESF